MTPAPKIIVATSLLLLLATDGLARASDAPSTLDVWPENVPGETGNVPAERTEHRTGRMPIILVTNVSKPTITVYLAPADKNTGAAVLICPGGAYAVLAWDLEGTEVAQWLNSIGVTGVIVKYRVPVRPGTPRYMPPLQDAQRAMSLVRSRATDWHIDPNRIGMLGFSAGGNLTGVASTHYDHRAYDPIDEIDKVSCRPDFAVLIYPAWLNREGTDELAPEVRVNAHTPRAFFVHANDDPIKSDSSVAMYLALKHAGVPAELHIYASGGHGFGLRPTTQPCSIWPQRCEQWLRSQGLLSAVTSHPDARSQADPGRSRESAPPDRTTAGGSSGAAPRSE